MYVRHIGPLFAPDGGTGSGADPGTGGGAAGNGGGGNPWYTGQVDQETVGHWQNRNWDVSDPSKVAVAATKAWRDLENATQALHGVPADRLLRLPQPGDEAATKEFHQKLGAPPDKTGYDFSGVKHANGNAVDPSLTASLADKFYSLGVSKDAAVEITKQIVALNDSAATSRDTEQAAGRQLEGQKLRTNWGQNYDNNLFVARGAAAKLGLTPAELDGLDGLVGHSRVMEMFRQIGAQLGEAPFTGSGPGGTGGPMTAEQAIARISDLKKDAEWVKKYTSGDLAARRELEGLMRMKLGGIDNSGTSGIPQNRR